MRTPLEDTGFSPHPEQRSAALPELLASAGLALATIVTAIVVTAGVAHAGVADGVIGNEGSVFAVALVLGLAFIGIGGLTLPGSRPKKH
jgi:uncharacterized membrane protein YphA (DoxX/SURF4 family)